MSFCGAADVFHVNFFFIDKLHMDNHLEIKKKTYATSEINKRLQKEAGKAGRVKKI